MEYGFLWPDLPLAFGDIAAPVVGMASEQAEYEPPQDEGADGEDGVADHSHPA